MAQQLALVHAVMGAAAEASRQSWTPRTLSPGRGSGCRYIPIEGQACACSRPSTEAHGLVQCSASLLGISICASVQLGQGLMTQDLRPMGSAVAAERMSTVEVEVHGSLAGGCAPGDPVTCVGLVKVLRTETATGDLPFLAFQAICDCA